MMQRKGSERKEEESDHKKEYVLPWAQIPAVKPRRKIGEFREEDSHVQGFFHAVLDEYVIECLPN